MRFITGVNGKVFKECGCHLTCEMLADNIMTCGDDICKPGCACPDDMVESEGKCIQKEECACYHMPTKEWYKVSCMIHVCSISC